MNLNSDSEEEQPASASTEKENATRLARQCGSPGCDLKDFHLGPCKSQHGLLPSGKASAAHWPSGKAAWVSRKGLVYPVVTGGYRDKPAPDKAGLVRVRYVSVKDKHRTIEDVPPSRLRAWDDVDARAIASRQPPSKNCDESLVAIVQRVADGEDADAVLRATRQQQQQQQRPLAAEPPPRQRQKQPRQPPPPPQLAVDRLLARRTKVAVAKGALPRPLPLTPTPNPDPNPNPRTGRAVPRALARLWPRGQGQGQGQG